MSCSATRWAKRDARPLSFFPTKGNNASSFLRWIQRMTRTPHTCARARANRSWEKGIRSSTVQPSESTDVAASHTGSQESSDSLPSPPIKTSFFTPAGFTMNSNAVRWSW